MARHLLSRLGAELQRHTKGLSIALEALGRHESLLTIDDGRSHRSTLRLTPRHSEFLLLLASTPRGLSGDELAVLLFSEDNSASTLRAELNRLRSLLVDDLLASRPYRPVAEVTADWLAVEAHLSSGDVVAATQAYRGPLPPRSVAPGVVRLRTDVEVSLRQAVLEHGVPELMSSWTRSYWVLTTTTCGSPNVLRQRHITVAAAHLWPDRQVGQGVRHLAATAATLGRSLWLGSTQRQPMCAWRSPPLVAAVHTSPIARRQCVPRAPRRDRLRQGVHPPRGCQRTKRLVPISACRGRASRHEALRPRPR